jgi:hypothetical protein
MRTNSKYLGPRPAEEAGGPRPNDLTGPSERVPEPDYSGGAGGVAQLAERYVRNVEAVGSNPITSTIQSVDPAESPRLRGLSC